MVFQAKTQAIFFLLYCLPKREAEGPLRGDWAQPHLGVHHSEQEFAKLEGELKGLGSVLERVWSVHLDKRLWVDWRRSGTSPGK